MPENWRLAKKKKRFGDALCALRTAAASASPDRPLRFTIARMLSASISRARRV
jgi:hypothetical protein